MRACRRGIGDRAHRTVEPSARRGCYSLRHARTRHEPLRVAARLPRRRDAPTHERGVGRARLPDARVRRLGSDRARSSTRGLKGKLTNNKVTGSVKREGFTPRRARVRATEKVMAEQKPKKVRWSAAWSDARELIWAYRGRLAVGAVLMIINQAMGLV